MTTVALALHILDAVLLGRPRQGGGLLAPLLTDPVGRC
jgi:hypothetical protein